MFGGQVGVLNESIFHLKRGYVYTIGEKKIFTFGGGYSIDKGHIVHKIYPGGHKKCLIMKNIKED